MAELARKALTEAKKLEKKLAEAVLEILEELLNEEITANEAARAFLEIYTQAPLPDDLEDLLATLILVDEPPEVGGPTRAELEEIHAKLRAIASQPGKA